MFSFPFYHQLDTMDCGLACLRMVAKYYGRDLALESLRKKAQYNKEGVSMLGLAEAAESIGFEVAGAKLNYQQLTDEIPLPSILYWDQRHFVVLLPFSRWRRKESNSLRIADPARGVITLQKDEFLRHWVTQTAYGSSVSETKETGIALLLEPSADFKPSGKSRKTSHKEIGWITIWPYLRSYKSYVLKISFGLLIGSALQLIFPYLTQSIVDTGVKTKNLNFIIVVLAAEIMLLFSQIVIEFIRNQVLLNIGTSINMALLSTFWSKLLNLPLHFFECKHPGDILQRIHDHQRVQNFLTDTSLNTLAGALNLVIFSVVLFRYNAGIFTAFAAGSLLYLLWIKIFLHRRRQLDYRTFSIAAKENNTTMQLVYGMHEIKLNNAEQTFRNSWEALQTQLFKLKFEALSLTQLQKFGAFFINQGKNAWITFWVARLVINGNLSLGAMLAIQYILGQLNGPLEQLIHFAQQAQDAKMSVERLNDIHGLEDEEPEHQVLSQALPESYSIRLTDVSFSYPGAGNEPVLKNITTTINQGEVTAIVGMSGSGKTTLLKILLKFYDHYTGNIYVGNVDFKKISPKFWRSVCGSVMQENYIFNDHIQKNITMTDAPVSMDQLIHACKTANILSYIESLPQTFYTNLGQEGSGISGGQKQRISIARAVYKNPLFIFFDEATNALDANNERVILKNLQDFFKNKTVLIVAHRLSTVRHANKIIVMDQGEIVEEGTHEQLILKQGKYFELVKNQLELGN